jgi:protein-S-isoprenylcysteine O-methyltransferase Ste14
MNSREISSLPTGSDSMDAVIRQTNYKMVLAGLVFGGLLFGSAGDLRWVGGWIFWVLLNAFMVSTTRFLARRQPDLLAERLRLHPGAKKWDLFLASAMAVWLPLAAIVVAGLDHRHGWTQAFPPIVQGGGVLLMLAGNTLVFWCMASNRFFSAVVRIQTDRGHRVVSGGPYGWIRHPGYLGALMVTASFPLILDSLWTWIPVGAIFAVTLLRTALEDRTLRRELPDYEDYAAKVRSRLLPGIW